MNNWTYANGTCTQNQNPASLPRMWQCMQVIRFTYGSQAAVLTIVYFPLGFYQFQINIVHFVKYSNWLM